MDWKEEGNQHSGEQKVDKQPRKRKHAVLLMTEGGR